MTSAFHSNFAKLGRTIGKIEEAQAQTDASFNMLNKTLDEAVLQQQQDKAYFLL